MRLPASDRRDPIKRPAPGMLETVEFVLDKSETVYWEGILRTVWSPTNVDAMTEAMKRGYMQK